MKKYIYLFISLFFIISAICFQTMYSTISINQAIYHLKVSFEGGNFQVFFAFLYRVLPLTLVIFLLLLIILYHYQIKPIKIKKIIIFPLNYLTKYLNKISTVILVISIILLCSHLNLLTYITNQFIKTNLYDKYYVDTSKVNILPTKKRNLIYIFVESLENTYMSKDLGGNMEVDLMPELSSLAKEFINFSNTSKIGGAYQVNNTEWTAASLVGQTSGLPLSLSLTAPSYDNDEYFFPDVQTLGDILYDNGYQNVFMLGSDANFGGRKSYFLNHGHYDIIDLDRLKQDKILDEDYYVWWGYEDSKLFTYAKDYLSKLSQSDQPFNFTLLTSDTHFVDGYLEEGCPKKYNNNISNVISCNSMLINDFINWIKEQPFYEDTTIIISGDHLYMDSYYLKTNNYNRTIYNVFINSLVDTPNKTNRTFSTLDMFPTTLASLGFKLDNNRLGLGTNLFSDQKTILEEIGIKKFNKEITKDSTFYTDLLIGTKK